MAIVFTNNPSIFMQQRCENEKWAPVLRKVFLDDPDSQPHHLENNSFNIFKNVLNVEGCIHAPKCISFMGNLPGVPGSPSSTSPTSTQRHRQLVCHSPGLGLRTTESLMPVLVIPQEESQTEYGTGRNQKEPAQMVNTLPFFLISGIQHVEN